MGMYKDQIPTSSGAIPICRTQSTGWIHKHFIQISLSHGVTLFHHRPLIPTHNCFRKCHKFLSPAKRRGGRPGLAAEERGRPAGNPYWHPQAGSTPHTLLGERARLHTLHLQEPSPTPQPATGQEEGDPLLVVLTGRSVKAMPAGRKGQSSVIR